MAAAQHELPRAADSEAGAHDGDDWRPSKWSSEVEPAARPVPTGARAASNGDEDVALLLDALTDDRLVRSDTCEPRDSGTLSFSL